MLTAPELVALPMTPKLVGANTLPVRFRMPELVTARFDKAAGLHFEVARIVQVSLHGEGRGCAVRAADTVTVPPPSLMSAPALSFA